MSQIPEAKPKSTLDLLRESRDAQAKEVESLQGKLDAAKAELKKLNAALKQWDKE